MNENIFQQPITSQTVFSALYTNSFDVDNLTLADVAMISQWDDPTKWLQVGMEISAKDHLGYNNPWIIVDYRDKEVYVGEDGTTEVQTGFFLQQKYHVPITTLWYTTTGAVGSGDLYGAPWQFLKSMDGAEYMATVVNNGVMLKEKMWIPTRTQIVYNGTDTFEYYNDAPNYASKVAAHLSSTPTVTTTYVQNICIALNTATQFYYATSTTSTSLGTSTSNPSSYAMQPRFCCFIKGKKKQEAQ